MEVIIGDSLFKMGKKIYEFYVFCLISQNLSFLFFMQNVSRSLSLHAVSK